MYEINLRFMMTRLVCLSEVQVMSTKELSLSLTSLIFSDHFLEQNPTQNALDAQICSTLSSILRSLRLLAVLFGAVLHGSRAS